MLSSPYPRLGIVRALILVGWLAGVASGIWVIVAPPVSYDFLGAMLTTVWGVMLAAGSAVAGTGWVLRRYQIETPGLIASMGGVIIYDYLTWDAVFTGSPGSGPRALLLVLLISIIAARIATLGYLDAQQRRRIEEGRGE